MKPRFKVLQLQPDYNVKTHDFADLGEQIVKSLPAERFEVTSGFLSGRPLPGQPDGHRVPPSWRPGVPASRSPGVARRRSVKTIYNRRRVISTKF